MATMTGIQSRAARVLLGWSQEELAGRAKINVSSVKRLEAGSIAIRPLVLSAVSAVFETAGVVFLGEEDRLNGRRVKTGTVLIDV